MYYLWCITLLILLTLRKQVWALDPFNPYKQNGSCMLSMSICAFELRASAAMTMFYGSLFRVIATDNGTLQNYQNPNQTFPMTDILTADGYPKLVYIFNNSLPGPVLHVYQNQTVRIRIYNDFPVESLSVHFHGIRQVGTPESDGVGRVTQLSILPGSSFLHEFVATDEGTFWYHSHIPSQTAMGLLGAFVVHANTMPEVVSGEFVLMLNDWQHFYTSEQHDLLIDSGQFYPNSLDLLTQTGSIDYLVVVDGSTQAEALITSILVNGRGQYFDPRTNESSITTPLESLNIQTNNYSIYRLRLINGGNAFSLKFSIDEHSLHVIASDGVPFAQPLIVDQLILGLGERFDVMIVNTTMMNSAINYWIRVDTIGQNNNPRWYGRAILQYTSSSVLPTTNRQNCTVLQPCRILNCPFIQYGPNDSSLICLTPQNMSTHEDYLDQTLLNETIKVDVQQTLSLTTVKSNGQQAGYESINYIGIQYPSMTVPILYNPQLARSELPCSGALLNMTSGEKCYHNVVVQFNDIVELLLINFDSDMHPIHLHGSTFHIVEQGLAQLNTTTGQFLANNPNIECNNNAECVYRVQNETYATMNMRLVKDTIQLPKGGYVRIRFRATNPGVWLLHCHTEPHLNRGMAIMIHVAEDRIQLPYSGATTIIYKQLLFIVVFMHGLIISHKCL